MIKLKDLLTEAIDKDQLVRAMEPIIRKANVGGWQADIDRSGSWGWSNRKYKNLMVWATPWWENEAGIAVQVSTMDGDHQFFRPMVFNPNTLPDDPKRAAAVYLGLLGRWLRDADGRLRDMNDD